MYHAEVDAHAEVDYMLLSMDNLQQRQSGRTPDLSLKMCVKLNIDPNDGTLFVLVFVPELACVSYHPQPPPHRAHREAFIQRPVQGEGAQANYNTRAR